MNYMNEEILDKFKSTVTESLEGIMFSEAILLDNENDEAIEWESLPHHVLTISLDDLGELFLCIPEELSNYLYLTILGDSAAEGSAIPDHDLEQEILNCIAGALLGYLPDRGKDFVLGLPKFLGKPFKPDEYNMVFNYALETYKFSIAVAFA